MEGWDSITGGGVAKTGRMLGNVANDLCTHESLYRPYLSISLVYYGSGSFGCQRTNVSKGVSNQKSVYNTGSIEYHDI